MKTEVMEYMVWVVELAAGEFFGGDKTVAYKTLKDRGIWDLFVRNYDVTHTLGAGHILDDMREILQTRKAS